MWGLAYFPDPVDRGLHGAAAGRLFLAVVREDNKSRLPPIGVNSLGFYDATDNKDRVLAGKYRFARN